MAIDLEEQAFLNAIRDDPAGDSLRVYCDWLEENSTPPRDSIAAFTRILIALKDLDRSKENQDWAATEIALKQKAEWLYRWHIEQWQAYYQPEFSNLVRTGVDDNAGIPSHIDFLTKEISDALRKILYADPDYERSLTNDKRLLLQRKSDAETRKSFLRQRPGVLFTMPVAPEQPDLRGRCDPPREDYVEWFLGMPIGVKCDVPTFEDYHQNLSMDLVLHACFTNCNMISAGNLLQVAFSSVNARRIVGMKFEAMLEEHYSDHIFHGYRHAIIDGFHWRKQELIALDLQGTGFFDSQLYSLICETEKSALQYLNVNQNHIDRLDSFSDRDEHKKRRLPNLKILHAAGNNAKDFPLFNESNKPRKMMQLERLDLSCQSDAQKIPSIERFHESPHVRALRELNVSKVDGDFSYQSIAALLGFELQQSVGQESNMVANPGKNYFKALETLQTSLASADEMSRLEAALLENPDIAPKLRFIKGKNIQSRDIAALRFQQKREASEQGWQAAVDNPETEVQASAFNSMPAGVEKGHS